MSPIKVSTANAFAPGYDGAIADADAFAYARAHGNADAIAAAVAFATLRCGRSARKIAHRATFPLTPLALCAICESSKRGKTPGKRRDGNGHHAHQTQPLP
jgi:hypothetical protein